MIHHLFFLLPVYGSKQAFTEHIQIRQSNIIRNVANLLRQIAPILLIGVGQSYVLFTGNIDLSVGSVVGMSCMISATLMCHGMNPWVSVVIKMACCLAVGCVNGVLVSKCKLPPFIATLGTMTIARGIAQIVN